MSFIKYIKSAFVNRWNLLAFLGGLGLSVATGHPEIVAPFVLAAEVAYLGLLGTHPKFQDYVNAQEARVVRSRGSESADSALRRLLAELPEKSLSRFYAVQTRCLELRDIANKLKHSADDGGQPLESFQSAGLDRLLWIYLRLLYTQHALARFLEKTSEPQIERDIQSLERQLAELADPVGNPYREKAKKTIQDNLATCRDRLANYRRARDTYELLQLEIDRLENKIHSLSELAVNRQEPDYISGQIDQVASSMVDTEQTMKDLRFATGLETLDEQVPDLLDRPAIQIQAG